MQSTSHKAGAPALNNWLGGRGETLSPNDALFVEDKAKHKALYDVKPWVHDVHYVKRCYISAIALIKLMLHAQTGKVGGAADEEDDESGTVNQKKGRDEWVEVLGQMQGHIKDEAVVLTDSFGIPVPATAVECSLDDDASRYLVNYNEMTDKLAAGKSSRVFGWYHTHPGYTAFLSGTDVGTQRFQQMMGGPVVALVYDPVRTLATGSIELKAFRTYPEKYKPTPADLTVRATIDKACQQQVLGEQDPAAGLIGDGLSTENNKKRDVAFYANAYYEVPITIFRSDKDAELLDQLWARFWSKTFSSSPHADHRHFANREMGAISTHLSCGCFALPSVIQSAVASNGGNLDQTKRQEQPSSDHTSSTNKRRDRNNSKDVGFDDKVFDVLPLSKAMGIDAVQGLLAMHVKKTVFN